MPNANQVRQVTNSGSQYKAASPDDIFFELWKDSITFDEGDDAGLDIEVNSDFLLSQVSISVRNKLTGELVADERREGSARLVVPKLSVGSYEIVAYTHMCVTNMQSGYIPTFDVLFDVSVNTVRISEGKVSESLAAAHLPLNGPVEKASVAPVVFTRLELDCMRDAVELP